MKTETPPRIPDHRLLHVIGRGAYGIVWLAENTLGRRRAIKVVRMCDSADPKALERERSGIQSFEGLSREHPSLVDILHAGILAESGDFYYVMELADDAGSDDPRGYTPLTLRRALDQARRFSPRDCLAAAAPIAGALAFLHSRGVVHRDVKPSNILYIDGQPKLADGGLAARTDESMTEVGTRGYLPNDQTGTCSADCFALGRVLHELAIGDLRPVHELPTELILGGDVSDFLELQEIVFKACDPDPVRRYPNGAAMEKDIRRVLSGESLRRARQSEHRARLLLRVAVAGVLAAAILGLAWNHEARRNRELEKLENKSRTHLTHLFLSNGRRALLDGYWSLAALWFHQALTNTTDAREADALRWRIGALSSVAPRLEAVGYHQGPVSEVAFSPDGRRFATASEDGTVQLLALPDAAPDSSSSAGTPGPLLPVLVATLRHEGPVNAVEFRRDNLLLATGSSDGTVGIWNATNGAAVFRLRHGGEVVRATFSPNGRLVAASGDEGRTLVWSTDTGESVLPELRHSNSVRWAEFSPDGRWLLTASSDHTARVWSMTDGNLKFAPLEHPAQVEFATFTPSGTKIVTAGRDGLARVWDIVGGTSESRLIQQGPLNCVGVSHDGKHLLTASGSGNSPGESRVWDIESGQPIGSPFYHSERVRFAAFSPDDRWVVSLGHDGIAQLRRTGASGQTIRLQHEARVWSGAFSPDGRRLLTAGAGRLWRLWDLAGLSASPFHLPVSKSDGVCATMSADGRWLAASANGTGHCRIWNLDRRGQPTKQIDLESYQVGSPRQIGVPRLAVQSTQGDVLVWDYSRQGFSHGPYPHLPPGDPRSLFSPDGKKLYHLSTSNGLVQAWSLDTGRRLWATTHLPSLYFGFPALSHDGTRLAVIGGKGNTAGGTFALFDTQTGKPLHLPRTGTESFVAAAFSPDDRWLAVGYDTIGVQPTEILVIDPRSGEAARKPIPMSDGVGFLAFSPDGRHLAASTGDLGLHFWSLPDFQMTKSIHLDRGVTIMEYSPDSQRLFTGCNDGAVMIWNSHTGEAMLSLPQLTQGLTSLECHPDGTHVLFASSDGEICHQEWRPATEDSVVLQRRLELDAGAEISADGSVSILNSDAIRDRWNQIPSHTR